MGAISSKSNTIRVLSNVKILYFIEVLVFIPISMTNKSMFSHAIVHW